MDLLSRKNDIMSNVSALNVLTEGLPKLKKNNSFSSINNKANSIDFLTDLIKALVGYEEMRKNITDIISSKLPEIESAIKKDLKNGLKEFISCGVNPSIPSWLKSNTNGVNIEVKNIDFLEIFKLDPESKFGNLLYDDFNSGINSGDLNTFLYSNINLNKSDYTTNGGVFNSWGSTTTNTDIIDIKFSPVGSITNNIFTLKVNQNYDNKSLVEFNNDLIDSISLFGAPNKNNADKLLSNIVDSLFGSVSKNIGKTKKQLKTEGQINKVIDCIINSDENDVIDDNYFTFTNDDLNKIEYDANLRKNGIRILETCGNLPVEVSPDILIELTNTMLDINNQTGSTSGSTAEKNAITKAIDDIANEQTKDAATIDVPTIKINFIMELIKSYVKSLVSFIVSPKLLMVYIINYKVIYGQNATYNDPIEFMNKNKNLIKSIVKSVMNEVVKWLITIAIKYISKKLAKKYAGDTIEKNKAYVAQILSLIGVTPDIIRQIQGFSSNIT